MQIKLLRSVVVKGHSNLEVGIPFDCNIAIARDLIIEGLAEAVDPAIHAKVADRTGKGLSATNDGQIETREPIIEDREPQPAMEKIPKRKKAVLP